MLFFFFKQKTAYEMRISDWSSDVCSSDLGVISGPGADIPFRIYRADMASSSAPAVIFFHGGGFVMGDLDSHDIVCRQLCKESACTVIAIDYRRAPEHRFPASVDAAVHAAALLRWLEGPRRGKGGVRELESRWV